MAGLYDCGLPIEKDDGGLSLPIDDLTIAESPQSAIGTRNRHSSIDQIRNHHSANINRVDVAPLVP
jgi:hypothetical protein